MSANLRVLLLAVMGAFALPAVAEAQAESTGDLVVRIDMLERRIEDLEIQVRELENLLKAATAPNVPAPQTWWDVENWRRVHRGMSTSDVRDVLGEPTRVEAIAGTVWYYGESPNGGSIFFDDRGRVAGWLEPRR